mmetsp:Transcript_9833/g.17905  ORF Transcript_9833/g.17905 Transcript_9833/m.17905 type:complete len:115 (-) Transcript_9833:1640-1984(-)
MIELGALEGYKRSKDVGSRQIDGTYAELKSATRTSENSWCMEKCTQDPVSRSIMERIVDVTGIPEENYESLQMLRYEENQVFFCIYAGSHPYIDITFSRPRTYETLTLSSLLRV